MKKQPSAYESFMKLTPAQRARAVAEFDKEFVADSFKPLSAAQQQAWRKAKRQPGRPKIGKGAEVVSVSIERALLAEADSLAKKLQLSRANLIARGLKMMLVADGQVV